MAEVKVILRPYLMGFANGQGEVWSSGANLGELLKNLGETYPLLADRVFDSHKGLMPGVTVHVNNRIMNLPSGLDYPLQEGDTVRLLLKIGGG